MSISLKKLLKLAYKFKYAKLDDSFYQVTLFVLNEIHQEWQKERYYFEDSAEAIDFANELVSKYDLRWQQQVTADMVISPEHIYVAKNNEPFTISLSFKKEGREDWYIHNERTKVTQIDASKLSELGLAVLNIIKFIIRFGGWRKHLTRDPFAILNIIESDIRLNYEENKQMERLAIKPDGELITIEDIQVVIDELLELGYI